MEDISLKEYYFILRKRMRLIILSTILCVVVSALVSYIVLTPKYQTFTTLIIGKPKGYRNIDNKLEYNDLLLNQKLASTYGELVKARVIVDEVIANLELDISYKAFREKVNVNLIKDTEIIKLEVTDKDPVLAAEIANETARVFMRRVKNIMMVENISIIDKAQVPDVPIKPRPKLNMAIASVLGFMVGIFLVFLLEYLDSTIKTPDDVERYLDLPIIGVIPMVEENK